jgi:delta(3,5)-delta(2,4)-dienoyl-CoA isomerase
LNAYLRAFQDAISAPERARVPVVVAMHGLVYGLGLDIALACDVRYAAADATFSIKVCPALLLLFLPRYMY